MFQWPFLLFFTRTFDDFIHFSQKNQKTRKFSVASRHPIFPEKLFKKTFVYLNKLDPYLLGFYAGKIGEGIHLN